MWARVLTALLGIWLMSSPDLLGFGDAARTSGQIAGPLAAAIGIVSASEVTRELRWVGLPIGLWLLLAPWFLGFSVLEAACSVASGLLIIGLSFYRGTVRESFGGGWAALFGKGSPDKTSQQT